MREWIMSSVMVMVAVVGVEGREPAPWPQFRGPGGSGVAAEGEKPPVEVGPETNVQWKVSVPSGLSSPIIVSDKLVLTALEDGKLYTIAYNRADGSEAWRAHAPASEIEPYHKTEGSPAASTPATLQSTGRGTWSRTTAAERSSAASWEVLTALTIARCAP